MRHLTKFALLTAMLAAPGCASKKPTDPTVFSPKKIHEIVAEDRARLEGIDSPHHISRTYLGVDVTGEGFFSGVGHVITAFPYRLYKRLTGESPMTAAVAMEDTRSPDNRRRGMMELAGYRFGRREPYVKRYDQIATEPAVDYTVRAASIRALNYSRSSVGNATFLAGLDDAEPAIRLESAKAIANIPNEKAIPKLLAHLRKDDSKDVRVACADALRNYRTLDVSRGLVEVLNDREFGVSWQARKSLSHMTGRDFHYNEAAWLEYLSKAKNPFL